MNILNPKFKYTPAKNMGPGYLKQRFEEIRQQQQKEVAADQLRKCIDIRKGKR